VSAFDTATAVRPLGHGSYAVDVPEAWGVRRGANGGVVAAVVLRALLAEVDDPTRPPRSLTVHYPAALDAAPARADVRIERSGRSLTSASLRLTQGDTVVALALGAFSADWPSVPFADLAMPDVPRPEDLPAFVYPEFAPAFTANFRAWLAAGSPPFAQADKAEAAVWLALRDRPPLDYPYLATLTDAWMPVLFATQPAPVLASTIDLTVHFRTPLPADDTADDDIGPWLCVFRTRLAAHGFMEEEGEIWRRDGVLLAQSRQLALAVPQ
jgi:acyl-CoA thioesterase